MLQGGCPSDTTVWFGDLGPFDRNGEEGRKGIYRVPQKYHREVIVADRRQDVGDAQV